MRKAKLSVEVEADDVDRLMWRIKTLCGVRKVEEPKEPETPKETKENFGSQFDIGVYLNVNAPPRHAIEELLNGVDGVEVVVLN